jgi:membrane fusion protein, multidrug efflux system
MSATYGQKSRNRNGQGKGRFSGLPLFRAATLPPRWRFGSSCAGRSRAAVLSLILAVSVAGLGMSVAGCERASSAAPAPQGRPASGGMPPMPVETALVTVAAMTDRFQAVGSIEATEGIQVVPEIDGIVTALPFKEGETVAAGELLVQLDEAQLKADLDRALALLEQSQVTYNRTKGIVDEQMGAQQRLDDAGAALKVAQANVDLARSRWSKTRITAPFSGVVGARRISTGAYVKAGQTLTELTRLTDLRVSFSAPERYLATLKQGDEVTVTTPAYPGMPVKGRITVIEPMLDADTRSAQIIASLDNPRSLLRPGMSALVETSLDTRSEALTIPSEAVFSEGTQSLVYRLNPDSTVSRVPVVLGTRGADAVEIREGLSPGNTVVRTGYQKLFPGAKVMPIPAQS